MYTKSGLWKIHNNTRYNTEDIVDLFNRVEDIVTKVVGTLTADRSRDEGQVMFRDYNPSQRTFRRSVWTPGGVHAYEEVVCYTRSADLRARHMRDVGLLRPTKLYKSPLESLTAARVDGHEVVPQQFVEDVLWYIITPCYHIPVPRQDLINDELLQGARIRVMPKRQEKRPEDANRSARVVALRNKHSPTYWAMRSAEEHLKAVAEAQSDLQGRFEALNFHRCVTAEMISAAQQAMEILKAAISKDDNVLREELQ